ncbi:hypothetical protein DD237_008526 [Peronospora effusa]|uniref:Uncharacterized protein n=1 Tax=Peronospora effusa TaxID=542832 RepID=A0A425C2Y7_9STRA|nr:hypothetical protein DD237_008526 [Peronospora effusa]
MQQGWLIVGELYDSCMNSNSTNSTMVTDASLKVLSPVLEQIAATKGKKKLFQVAGVLHNAGTSFSKELGVELKARKVPLLEGRMLLMYLTDQNANVFVQMPDFFKRVEKLVTGNSVTLETLKIVLMNQFIGIIEI